MANLDDFLVALCQRMGWEPTTWRLNVLREMARQEGNVDHLAEMWNPLSTTMPAGGAKDWNSVGVKIYPDMATGVEATALTLEQEGYYPGLLATMEAQSPQPGVEQGLKTWGWQDAGRLSPAGQQILNVMGGTGGGNMATPTQSADVTAAQPPTGGGTGGGFGTWTEQNDPDFPWRDRVSASQPGAVGNAWLGTLSSQERGDKYDRYVQAAGLGTSSSLAPEEAAYKTAQTAKIEQELADYPRLVSMDEREQKRKEIETEIAAGTLEWNKGVDKFNAWLNATSEARLRAEKEMEQKEWQLPTKYFPGTEPGGMLATVAKRYGLPWTPLEGTPVTPESSAEGVYNKWQKNMGAPLQAPAFPEMREMAGGGYLPAGQSAITSELGPELVTATPRGAIVKPLTPAVYPGGDPYVVTPPSTIGWPGPDYPQARPPLGGAVQPTAQAPTTQFPYGSGSRNVLGYGPNAALQAPREGFSFATARQPGEPGSLDPNWTGRDLNIPGGAREITMYPWEGPQVAGGQRQLYLAGGQMIPAPTAAHAHVYGILQRARRGSGGGQSRHKQRGQHGREV